jgi:hypothetical protein
MIKRALTGSPPVIRRLPWLLALLMTLEGAIAGGRVTRR